MNRAVSIFRKIRMNHANEVVCVESRGSCSVRAVSPENYVRRSFTSAKSKGRYVAGNTATSTCYISTMFASSISIF